MGREIQKEKRRSKRPPVRPKKKAKVLNPRGNSAIAQNWDKTQTLTQNYRRLGLVARLKGPTGGVEKTLSSIDKARRADPFAITTLEGAVVSEVAVERDSDGRIVRLLDGAANNPLHDPLCALDSDDEEGRRATWGGVAEAEAAAGSSTDVVNSLIRASHNPAPKRPRHQSEREKEWLTRLVDRYGEDTAAMARDHKLNPMQQTAADIASRIKRMQQSS